MSLDTYWLKLSLKENKQRTVVSLSLQAALNADDISMNKLHITSASANKKRQQPEIVPSQSFHLSNWVSAIHVPAKRGRVRPVYRNSQRSQWRAHDYKDNIAIS